jgi:hypothetical protein
VPNTDVQRSLTVGSEEVRASASPETPTPLLIAELCAPLIGVILVGRDRPVLVDSPTGSARLGLKPTPLASTLDLPAALLYPLSLVSSDERRPASPAESPTPGRVGRANNRELTAAGALD